MCNKRNISDSFSNNWAEIRFYFFDLFRFLHCSYVFYEYYLFLIAVAQWQNRALLLCSEQDFDA
jgi:hypothetical protein